MTFEKLLANIRSPNLYMRSEHQDFRPGESQLTPVTLPEISSWGIACRLMILVVIAVLVSAIQTQLIREYRESTRPPLEPMTRGYVLTCATIRTAGRPRADAHLQYRYTVGDNSFTVKTVVSGSTCTKFLPKSPVYVHYDESSPGDSQLYLGRIEARTDIGIALLLLMLFTAGVAWDFVHVTEYMATYHRTVRKFGVLRAANTILDGTVDRAALGEWMSISYLVSRLTTSKHIYVAFRFESPTGKTLRGKQVFDWPLNQSIPKRGTPVKILYANDDAYLLL